jgi:ubiquinone/menaquinone biosynthesis C-methylase UbiE
MLSRASKKNKFRALEIGSGKVPTAIIKAAQRLNKLKRPSEFHGTDIASMRILKALKLSGLKKLPKNLTLKQADALRTLTGHKAESCDLIYAGYVLPTISHEKQGFQKIIQILRQAHRVLKPRGRFIITMDRVDVNHILPTLQSLGFTISIHTLTDAQAKRSDAPSIRALATAEGRAFRVILGGALNGQTQKLRQAQKDQKVQKLDELARPTVIILRKK